ncbi:MAG TPA: hypothetical protein DCR65_12185 [Gammaproteobacteria bacterium]|jgi:hypothetical protein|nr:hypothetical protein [Gammaproteobacteria bacterium]
MLEIRGARMRLAWFLLVGGLAAVAAACWFGSDGLVPLLLWLERARPRLGNAWSLDLSRVAAVERRPLITVLIFDGGRRHTIFRDELDPPTWAALRRGPATFAGLFQPGSGRSTSRRSE